MPHNPHRIDPRQIAFDIDGVIADTMNLFLEIAREDFDIRDIRYEDITSYDLEECLNMDRKIMAAVIEKLLHPDAGRRLKPIPGAIDVLNRIGRHAETLLLVTAREDAGPIREWIHTILSLDSKQIRVEATGTYDAKTDVLVGSGKTVFVEDRLETCFPLKDVGITPVVFVQPWNRRRHPFIEVSTWKEIERLLDF